MTAATDMKEFCFLDPWVGSMDELQFQEGGAMGIVGYWALGTKNGSEVEASCTVALSVKRGVLNGGLPVCRMRVMLGLGTAE